MGELPQTLKIHKHRNWWCRWFWYTNENTNWSTLYPRDIKETEDIGHKNFKYMFNSLPAINKYNVKGLMGEIGKVENFINFNEKTRESIEDETEGGNSGNDVDLNDERVRIPKGTN